VHRNVSESFPSSSEKRSRIRLCLDVLRTISRGVAKPTNIMYRSNLSWGTLMRILDLLTEEGLVEFEIIGKRKIYRITRKGLDTLEYYRKIEEIFMSIE